MESHDRTKRTLCVCVHISMYQQCLFSKNELCHVRFNDLLGFAFFQFFFIFIFFFFFEKKFKTKKKAVQIRTNA